MMPNKEPFYSVLCNKHELAAVLHEVKNLPVHIIGSAILLDEEITALLKPARHHHIIQLMHFAGDIDSSEGIQGFITNSGEFVGRQEALVIARNANQLLKDVPIHGERLYSENLW